MKVERRRTRFGHALIASPIKTMKCLGREHTMYRKDQVRYAAYTHRGGGLNALYGAILIVVDLASSTQTHDGFGDTADSGLCRAVHAIFFQERLHR